MKDSIYIYDGSFNNLLGLISILLKNNIKPFNIKNNLYDKSLMDNLVHLKILEDNYLNKYLNYMGFNIFKIIWYVFVSNEDNKELIIYYFLLNYIKFKDNIVNMRNLNCVLKSLKIAKYVGNENHKYKGFVRFKELQNNILYAEIEPENDILEILSFHFKNRLKNEFWIIKDVKRKIYSLYNKKDFYIVTENDFKLYDLRYSDNEVDMEKLWQTFYKTIGIVERKNDRCRMNFMPKKYWKYLVEMSD